MLLTPRVTLVAALFALSPSLATGQAHGNKMWAFHGGVVIPEEASVYLDDPLDGWADRKVSVTGGATYYFSGGSSFRYGIFSEFETINFDVDTGFRLGTGLAFAGRHPAQGTGLQLGGGIGLSYASLGDLDGQIGLDFQVAIGPVFPVSPKVDLGIHLVGFYGWYGGGDVPEGVMNANGRVRAQVQFHR